MNTEALEILTKIGQLSDDEIDLCEAALALGSLYAPSNITLQPYKDHIQAMETVIASADVSDLEDKAKTISKEMFDAQGYEGNAQDYDDLDNANLLQVIEKRKGLPVALGLIYIHLGLKQGWDICGLNFPGHFVIRLSDGGERVIIDPFQKGKILQANDLRQILKQVLGENAELSASFYEPVTRRDVLMRLQNNIKVRLIRDEEYAKAIEQIEVMRLIAPDEEKLLFDAGILHSKIGNLTIAIDLLESYKQQVSDPREKEEASALIYQISKLIQ